MPQYLYYNQINAFLILSEKQLSSDSQSRLAWILQASVCPDNKLKGAFVGPRKEMVSPWSTNACDVFRNMGISGITRAEIFENWNEQTEQSFDPMLQARFDGLHADSLAIDGKPQAPFAVTDIEQFNSEAGLALSPDEIEFLKEQQKTLGREFTDCELFAFAQINSEHCRHKIFNGTFIIDGKEQPKSLFSLIKDTTAKNGTRVVSAYKDNVAFIKGPRIARFAPRDGARPSPFKFENISTVISLKAETHNFPTTVEPFYGASTGTGGEIRDRMAGGQGGIPLVGTAVYMTAHPRLQGSFIESLPNAPKARPWKYQTPEQILIKASNGASDFGNKFGQPLICGSVVTFEGEGINGFYGFDRCIMLGGGVGFTPEAQAKKLPAEPGDLLVLLGGDNYRIGMAGGSVSSVASGAYARELELSAVQRANPEMQKRVYNAIRSLIELSKNPIKIIHDHGAGGHVNCFSELLEEQGGRIQIEALPIGDQTLSVREILCNESQERMGLIVKPEDIDTLRAICARERAPLYVVGKVDGSHTITFESSNGEEPFHMPTAVLFGAPPRTTLKDSPTATSAPNNALSKEPNISFGNESDFWKAVKSVFSLEAVACKDWLTNKVDRCVSGHVAQQQCVGPLHLPLSNVGVAALDYTSNRGIATAIGSAPVVSVLDECAGSILSVAEALTNIMWAPLEDGLSSVALSANWMWPCKQAGEDARLYRAVEALSKFAIELGIPVPTGKDSLSMTMNYDSGDKVKGDKVKAPGTVVVSAAAPVTNHLLTVTPDLQPDFDSVLLFIDLSGRTGIEKSLNEKYPLGASALAQTQNALGSVAPTVHSTESFRKGFAFIQDLIQKSKILSGHDVSAGGLITTLCEMAFGGDYGIHLSLPEPQSEATALLFCECPAVVIQIRGADRIAVTESLYRLGLWHTVLGTPITDKKVRCTFGDADYSIPLSELRHAWVVPSHRLDLLQTAKTNAEERFQSLGKHPLTYRFPKKFDGLLATHGCRFQSDGRERVKAAVIREQGTNGERELAFSLFAAGFDVRDVTMTDLLEGRETLSDVHFVGFPGGFANSDVLGSARGWAGSLKYDSRALASLTQFLKRPNTLSIGICNGCQLMVALDLLYPQHTKKMEMRHNASKKFESAFVGVEIGATKSVMLQPLIGSRLGIWVAHGEGRFHLPEGESAYDIPVRYVSGSYPANPNGADFNAAAVCSQDGRHLVIMPHLERSALPWHWAYYPYEEKRSHQISPWMLAFAEARRWIEERL